ncbi:hypothetical protein Rhe02_62660 [Rhizocola hellebori]|uniref:Uncharacterized protein n=2 Tax=Rhizocola hellebori TaxID=1392758 RepID=A0A8J3VIA1_9ACTN|nr:hypothetical protein Rhe02_62660 [Rhizocola hellebori]
MVRRLPDIATLKNRCRSMAVLDAILSPEWEFRYYSYNRRWSDGQEMASMRNGSGDDYFIVFTPEGAFIRGFAHESSMSPWRQEPRALWPGLLNNLPDALRAQADEPAFGMEGLLLATFCLWRQPQDDRWRIGDIDYSAADPEDLDPDGADWLLGILTDASPDTYLNYAAEYFEIEADPQAVAHVYSCVPLTDEVVLALNPGIDLGALASDLDEIGYPVVA